MKTGKKLLTGTLLALCAALLVLCSVLAIGWSKAAKTNAAALPEVRNNGTAIQWKYSSETDWRDLVSLTELRGAAGENGKNGADGKNGVDGKNGTDGKNGVDGKNGADGKNGINGTNGKDGINGVDGKDGKDGINAKNIEVQRAETHIQWRYEGDEWQNLVAIADIEGPAGQNGKDGANGKTPEFRVNENALQWRYVGDEIWLNLYDLSVLKGLDGKDGADGKDGINGKDGIAGKDGTNGQNGSDGKDGNTPFIGENGNWWIGETDTGVKAAGVDGEKGDKGDPGEKGDKGEKGDNGDKGDKGDPGQNGSCSGYFCGEGYVPSTHLSDGAVPLYYREMHNRGGLISYNGTTLRLKKGHTYSVCVSGMVNASTNDKSGYHSVRMTDGYDDNYCRYITLIEQSSRGSNSLCFNRIYDLTGAKNDVELKFSLEQGDYKTYLLSFRGSVTIIALD